VTVEEQLRRESAGRTLAVAGAAAAAVLQLAGAIWRTAAFHNSPSGKNKDAAQLLFVHHHAGALVGSSIVAGIGAVAMILALRYLYDATKFRRPELPPVARYCAIGGPVIFLAGQVASSILIAGKASDFSHLAHAAQTNHAAKHIVDTGALKIAAGGALAGQLALGFAFVLISLNAMRVGLLSRFMGVLGIIVGILFVVPIGSPVPVVQAFWLVALAVLFAGRWPSGAPPAWSSGRAEPWPSPQQMRERARDGAGGAPAGPPDPTAEPEPVPAGGGRAGGNRRRKRKKRR
jgi:hypothetical protein